MIIFNNFVEKLNRFSNKKIARVEKDVHFQSAEYFEMAVKRIGKVFDCLNKNDIKLF